MSHRLLTLLIALSTLVGMGCLIRYLFRALTLGFTPGRLGAIHYAGSVSYAVSVAAMGLGLAMGVGLLWMCWRWLRDPDLG